MLWRARKAARSPGALDVSQVRRIVYAAAKKAGLEQKVLPHQATLGHASVSTTGRHLHARPTESSSFYLPA